LIQIKVQFWCGPIRCIKTEHNKAEHSNPDLIMKPDEHLPTKKQELRAFLVLTVITAPILAVMLVGGYGFIVWMTQLLSGPPVG
jgi:periplasmic nitrate reductase NapE